MTHPILKYYKSNTNASCPVYATASSACFDLCACLSFPILTINPGQRVLVSTGLIFDIPKGFSLRLHPRSGLALKNGLTLLNCEGVIDEDYVDAVGAILLNTSADVFVLNHGDRICQAELVRDIKVDFEEIVTPPLKKTDRSGGFGSTGK